MMMHSPAPSISSRSRSSSRTPASSYRQPSIVIPRPLTAPVIIPGTPLTQYPTSQPGLHRTTTEPQTARELITTLVSSYWNALLIFVPISWIIRFTFNDPQSIKDTLIFVFSFLALIPLQELLVVATTQLSLSIGLNLGDLVNATAGNGATIAIVIFALMKCELRIVQAYLVGSIVFNLFLVSTMSYPPFASVRSEEWRLIILTISILAILLPAIYRLLFNNEIVGASEILSISHGVAIILLFIFVFYLSRLYKDSTRISPRFEPHTDHLPYPPPLIVPPSVVPSSHRRSSDSGDNFVPNLPVPRPETAAGPDYSMPIWSPPPRVPIIPPSVASESTDLIRTHTPPMPPPRSRFTRRAATQREGSSYPVPIPFPLDTSFLPRDGIIPPSLPRPESSNYPQRFYIPPSPPTSVIHIVPQSVRSITPVSVDKESQEGEHESQKLPPVNISTLVIVDVLTMFIVVTAKWLVDSIDGFLENEHISTDFVGIILLPLIGVARPLTVLINTSASTPRTRDSPGSTSFDSGIQITVLILPFTVILAWITGKPLTLMFDPLESITLFLAVIAVNYVVQGNSSIVKLNRLIMLCPYAILGLVFWYYPGSALSGAPASCH